MGSEMCIRDRFEDKNRFEGKSNYYSYIPAGEPINDDPLALMHKKHIEQKLEAFWFDFKNTELAEKRRDEETY